MTYNGWKNRSTWTIQLWISNEEGLDRAVRGLAVEHAAIWGDDDRLLEAELADTIKDFVEDILCLDSMRGPALDLLTNAIDETDWIAIARAALED